MKSIKIGASLLLLSSAASALEHDPWVYRPWFTPPFELQGRLGYFYTHANHVQSPLGDFHEKTRNSSAHLGLAFTPWTHLNLETDLYFTHTSDISFTYEAALATVRYAWMDDIEGDWLTVVTGATLSFPGTRFLHELSLPYHGNTNCEFHVTVGKEWSCRSDWITRVWALGGYGIANKGSPWAHGIAAYECHFSRCLDGGLFAEALYGLGHRNIIPLAPFAGYAKIRHQTIDVGAYIDYDISYFGTLTLLGWYNVHAHNFINHAWGINLSLLVPFSLL